MHISELPFFFSMFSSFLSAFFFKFSIPRSPFSNCLFSFLVLTHSWSSTKTVFILHSILEILLSFFFLFHLFISERLVALSAQDLQSPGHFTVIVTNYTSKVSSLSHNRPSRKNSSSDINTLPLCHSLHG